MTTAVIVEVAEKVKDEIAEIDFGEDVIVRRIYGDENDELTDADFKQIVIDVEIWSFEPDLDTSDFLDYQNTINIFIRRNMSENEQELEKGTIDIAEKDRMIRVIEQVWEHFVPPGPTQGTLTTESGHVAKYDAGASRILQLWSRPDLKRVRQFRGWIRLKYDVSKAG